MPIPTPEPGLVISYAYLWDHEAHHGQEEGRKDRPCVIALAIERQPDGDTLVTVLPVTHRPPTEAGAAVEIPPAVKRHLGLDDEKSWVILDEVNEFEWPGFDLRPMPKNPGRYNYGFLPPRLFAQLMTKLRAAWRAGGGKRAARGK